MRFAAGLAIGLLGCNGSSGAEAPADAGAIDASIADARDVGANDAPDAFTGPTIRFVATAVESPSGAPIPGVTACAYAQPGIPCVTADDSGVFDLLLPADAETGVMLSVTDRESVLLPIVTTSSDIVGYRIGMTDVVRMTSFAQALGLTFPPTTNGFLFADVAAPGNQAGVAGVTATLAPRSGSGPLYFGSSGTPNPQATSTSDFGVSLFGGVSPGEVTVTFAPVATTTLTCRLYFGGWPSTQRNAVRVGFDTHVAMQCTARVPDAGSMDASGDAASD